MNTNDKWNTQLRKGSFELAILLLIKNKPMYGYELTKSMQDSGIFPIADGSIYPILKRLTANDWMETYTEEHEGRSRKYYRITAAGKNLLEDRWAEFEKIFLFLQNLNQQ